MRQERVGQRRDAALAQVAARQHGVITLAQLRRVGVGSDAIKRRVAAGRLYRIFRGVYAVGHDGLGNEGKWMAAVLACAGGAALSHRSAAELWGMLKPVTGPLHVTVPVAGGRRKRTGLRIYRSPHLTPAVTTRRLGIAVTTPARTIADLRRVAPPKLVRRAIRQAQFDGLAIGDEGRETGRTRSDLELRFLRLCRRHGLPGPEVNVPIGHFTVDFFWGEHGLVVEDRQLPHAQRVSGIPRDRERDNEPMERGLDVLRFTDLGIGAEPAAVAALVRARLDRPG